MEAKISLLKRTIAIGATVLLCVLASSPSSALDGRDRTARDINYFGPLNRTLRVMLNDNERLHLNKAIKHLRSGNEHELEYVRYELTYMLNRWANHPRGLQSLIEYAIRSGDHGFAKTRFTKALSVAPDVPQTRTLYGIYWYKREKYPQAIEQFEKAAELAPDSAETNYNLGLAYFATKQYAKANEYAQKAYGLGYPLDGLRHRLKEAGHWDPSVNQQAAKDGAS